MSHRKTDLGIPCRAKSAKVVLSAHLFPESPAGGTGAPIWMQVELSAGRLHVRRSKRGTPSVHPMQGDEIRALRRLQREQGPSPHVFVSERGGPMSAKSFGTTFARLGERAGMTFPIHPHMLRHGCGYALANAGHDTRPYFLSIESEGV